jgi:outer membrane protein
MRSLRLVALLAIPAQVAFAQQPAKGAPLSLEDAINTARRENPLLAQTKNNLRAQDAQVRAAYGQLMPRIDAGFGTSFNQGGTQILQGGIQLPGTDSYNSSYNLSLSYNVTAAVRYAPRAAKANREAAEADVVSRTEALRAQVTQDYVTAVQTEATAAVLDSLVQTAAGQLELTNAKLEVGAGTIIDVRAAEVALGQARVNSLTAHNNAQVAKLRMFQTMGVPADLDAKLTTTFPIAQPTFTLDSVLSLAHRTHPDLAALKQRQTAADMNVSMQKSSYLPQLSLSTGYSAQAVGYTDDNVSSARAEASALNSFRNCVSMDSLRAGAGLPRLSCGSPTLSDDALNAARATNRPWQFNKAPYNVGLRVSLPIFNGFFREQQVENARVQRDNAAYDVRARNLQVTTDVTQAYLNLVTAAKTVELQTQIAAKSAEDLALNEASYRVGNRTFLDVNVARAQYEQTQIARVNAIYDYHSKFAALEQAVGRPLR